MECMDYQNLTKVYVKRQTTTVLVTHIKHRIAHLDPLSCVYQIWLKNQTITATHTNPKERRPRTNPYDLIKAMCTKASFTTWLNLSPPWHSEVSNLTNNRMRYNVQRLARKTTMEKWGDSISTFEEETLEITATAPIGATEGHKKNAKSADTTKTANSSKTASSTDVNNVNKEEKPPKPQGVEMAKEELLKQREYE
jgi:hypothetical protein